MSAYEISSETLAIIPIENFCSKVIEKDNTIIVSKTPMQIIEDSCSYFGSSYFGRAKGTKKLIGVSHKAPVIIEESKEIIFFPTRSPRLYECCWVSLKNIDKYKKQASNSLVFFNNGHSLELDMSYGSLDNQILRATRLESVLRARKNI
ncbi:MAG: competence protein ComK [Bacilli bacterium]|nr:competence protein ComK [Bacilli bacterium]MDD4298362.1 competence protein ComK [Bacilli bacterium]MDD4644112.1 competence protein ComK [Bacilli bacterium]